MNNLRSLHLYLGCVFAPMLLFFAVSGIWQMFGVHSPLLDRLSTIHTSHELKSGLGMSNGLVRVFVLLMALSFIVTTILGVVLAVRQGRGRRAAVWCLSAGVVIPLALILLGGLG